MRIDGDAFLGIICREKPGGMWLLANGRSSHNFPLFGWRYLRISSVRRNRG